MNNEAQSNLLSTVILFVILAIGAYLGVNYLAPIVAASLKPAVTPTDVRGKVRL